MKAEVEKFTSVAEPEWILDKTGSGSLYWRRDSTENNPRVKFRFDVEVKEFQRGDFELEEAEWLKCTEITATSQTMTLSMGILCIFISIVLPWYMTGVIIGTS